MTRVAVIGGGVMGETLVSAMTPTTGDGSGAGAVASIVVAEARDARRDELQGAYDVEVVADPAEAAAGADVVLVAVKPQDIDDTLDRIRPMTGAGTLLVSVCAGVRTDRLERGVAPGTRVVRVMPNTPARFGNGASAMCAGSAAGEDDLATTRELLGATGLVVTVQESQMDAVTGLSGSGPAYVLLFLESLVAAGVEQGLSRDVARDLAIQTLVGTARMAGDSDEHPAALRDAVTSPGGTTAAGLAALEDGGLRATVAQAVRAATERSAQLG